MVVLQLAQLVPARRAADYTTQKKKNIEIRQIPKFDKYILIPKSKSLAVICLNILILMNLITQVRNLSPNFSH